MRVSGLVVAVGDDHLGPLTADDRDQPPGGLVDVGLMEAVRMVVRFGVGHARVAVAEHLDDVEADDLSGRRQFAGAHRRNLGPLLLGGEPVERLTLLAQRGVLQVALLATGAAHQHGADALVVVLGERRCTLGGLVVGMGVNGQQRSGVRSPR